jgi:hypothetical protein
VGLWSGEPQSQSGGLPFALAAMTRRAWSALSASISHQQRASELSERIACTVLVGM